MKIPVSELTKKYKAVLATSGAAPADVDAMTRLSLEQDLHDNYFSGLWDVEGVINKLRASTGKTHVLDVDKPALKLVDCRGRATGLVSLDLIPELCTMAREQGIAIIGLHNGGYQSMPEVFARSIAADKLVGLVAAAGGPACVVPYGGRKSIFGTNPIAYGIPTSGLPIVFDASTSKYPYGSIQLAQERDEQLPERSYLDSAGDWTTDPDKAVGIISFGEHRGYAINLLIEVLAGALVRAKSGLLQTEESDMGAFLLAIDPAAFGPLDEFLVQATKLAEDIESSGSAEGYELARVPGYRGERFRQKVVADDLIEIDDRIWQKFEGVYARLVGK